MAPKTLPLCTPTTAWPRVGKYEEAESIYRQILESWINSQGESYIETIRVRQNLGALYFDYMNRRGQAVTQQEHVLNALKKEHGENHSKTLLARSILGRYHGVLGNSEEVISLIEPILNGLLTRYPDHIEISQATLALAQAYDETERFSDAEVLLLQTLTTSKSRFENNPRVREPVDPNRAMQALVMHYNTSGENEKLEAWKEEQKKLRTQVAETRKALGSTAPARDEGDRDMTIRIQVDGTSFLYLKDNRLWLSHIDGKGSPAGKHKGNFPTSVDRKEWMPTWKEKVTNPLQLSTPLPYQEEDFTFSSEVLSGRGRVSILEQPSEENDFTAKLELSDLTDNGAQIFGHDWIVFQLSW